MCSLWPGAEYRGNDQLNTDIVGLGNERLQQMMGIMASERGGRVFATDER